MVKKSSKKVPFFPLLIILFIVSMLVFSYLLMNFNRNRDIQGWTTYTNTVGKFSIQYPSTWTITESHELSNRTVDNPDEINTTTLNGSEEQIVLQWGPMGFGGGCDPQSDMKLVLKDSTIHICGSVNNNKEDWSQIYSPTNHNPTFGAYTSFNSNYEQTMKKIFSTLSFTN